MNWLVDLCSDSEMLSLLLSSNLSMAPVLVRPQDVNVENLREVAAPLLNSIIVFGAWDFFFVGDNIRLLMKPPWLSMIFFWKQTLNMSRSENRGRLVEAILSALGLFCLIDMDLLSLVSTVLVSWFFGVIMPNEQASMLLIERCLCVR